MPPTFLSDETRTPATTCRALDLNVFNPKTVLSGV